MKHIIYLFLLSLSFNWLSEKTGGLFTQPITKQKLTEDLLQLKAAIQEYNPALSIYNPDFVAKADSLIAMLPDGSFLPIEAFQQISQLCAFSNEGHFSIGTSDDKVRSGFMNNEYRYLPITVKVVQGTLFVWIDISMEQSLKRGDEILSINGLTAKDILEKMYQISSSDGSITTYIDRNIERGFSWRYYLYMDRPDTFLMEVKDTSGLVRKLQVEALSRKAQVDNFAKYYPSSGDADAEEEAFYTLKQEGDVAFLTLPSFDFRRVNKYEVKSKQLYKAIFSELKEKAVKHLVIDLRGNTGGRNEFADDIVPFLLKKQVEAPFLKKTISWDGKTRTYKFPGPSKLAFSGDLYVLVDGGTFSAGNTLARYLHEYGDATMIGEETGTRYEGFAAGSSQDITLNHSQIKIGIPRYHIVFPASEKQTTSNRGLLPEHQIEYTIDDLIKGKDLHLDKARSLILKK